MLHIRVAHEGAVGIITIDRAARFNSLDVATAQDLRRAGLQMARDEKVRAVILRGAGSAFCSGADLKYIASGGEHDDLAYLTGAREVPQAVLTVAQFEIVEAALGLAFQRELFERGVTRVFSEVAILRGLQRDERGDAVLAPHAQQLHAPQRNRDRSQHRHDHQRREQLGQRDTPKPARARAHSTATRCQEMRSSMPRARQRRATRGAQSTGRASPESTTHMTSAR